MSHRDFTRAPTRPALGFTLIEVLVALVILGIGISAVLIAYSGSMRLMRESSAYQSAVLLARSKLDETWVDPGIDISDSTEDSQEERYNGVLYAYRITVRPVPILEEALAEKITLPVELQEILVEVFWGEENEQRTYRLSAFRMQDRKAKPAVAPNTPAGK